MRWLLIPGLAMYLWSQAATPSPATGILAGQIVDAAGRPVADVVVTARPAGMVFYQPGAGPVPVRTNTDGRFVFTHAPAGRHHLDATKAGWLPGAFGMRWPGGIADEVELGAGQTKADLRITLWRPAVIGGTVTDERGDPVVQAEVRAVQLGWVAGRRHPVGHDYRGRLPRARTDDRGAFRFFDLPPGHYVVAVLATALTEPAAFANAESPNGQTPREYLQTMAGGGSAPMLFRRPSMPSGVEGALVSSLDPFVGYATTYAPGSQTESGAAMLSMAAGEVNESVNIQVSSSRMVTVSGTLSTAEGPAAWHAVHLVQADTAERPLVDTATAVTDAAGRFTLTRVPAGEYFIRTVRVPWPVDGQLSITGGTGEIPRVAVSMSRRPPPYPAAPPEPALFVNQPLSVGREPIAGLTLTLAPGPQVRGRAEFVGRTAPTPEQRSGTAILLEAASGRSDDNVMPSRVDDDGAFLASAIWPSRYIVTARPPAGWFLKGATYQGRDVTDTPLDVEEDIAGVVVTFVDRETLWNGTVQGDAETPAAEMQVVVFPADARARVDYGRGGRRVRAMPVRSDGTFGGTAPPPGEYFVVAIPASLAADWRNPATLERWAAIADRVTLTDTPMPISVRVRRPQ